MTQSSDTPGFDALRQQLDTLLAQAHATMPPPPEAIGSLTDLRRMIRHRTPWHAMLVQRDIGGGRTAADDLLAGLQAQPLATALTVSGLSQSALEALCRSARQLMAIHFWKCPRLEDLSPLQDMPQLEYVAFYWNQRATRLWDFRKTPALRGLCFEDFSRLDGLGDLAHATTLAELDFGNAINVKFQPETLEPLAALTSLRSLCFNARSIRDGRIQPLGKLTGLRELDTSKRLFTTEQLAWLRARLPQVESKVLAPFRRLRQPLLLKGKQCDVIVNGKGKPFLSSEIDASKLSRHVAEFEAMVRRFTDDPSLEPRAAV